MEAQYRLQQQRMANLAHAFHRRTIGCTLYTGDLNLQAKQTQALCAVFNPVRTALDVGIDATKQFFSNARHFKLVGLFSDILEPAIIAVFINRAKR